MTSLRIAVIGAGPAGLALTRLLQKSEHASHFRISIFEKDASPTARGQQVGGTLDLHETSGLLTIRAAGLWDEFQKLARYDGEAIAIADKNGTRLVDVKPSGRAAKAKGDRPEIDRQQLTNMLLDSISPASIKWGHKLKKALPDGQLIFHDSRQDEDGFDLIVGTDGAWSRIRPIVTDIMPRYAGISGFELRIDDPDHNCPEVSEEIGPGSVFAYGDHKSLIAQRMGDRNIKVNAWGVLPETYCEETMAVYSKQQVKDLLMNRYADWAPSLRRWISLGDVNSLQSWPLYELPVGIHWDHVTGYTLAGDSAHLMTPFAGEGVNTALFDALELSQAIVKGFELSDLDTHVRRYEADMFERATKATTETHRNKTLMFRSDAPLGFMMGMTKVIAEEKKQETALANLVFWPSVQNLIRKYFSGLLAFGAWRRRMK